MSGPGSGLVRYVVAPIIVAAMLLSSYRFLGMTWLAEPFAHMWQRLAMLFQ
jgi:hypothetical protein